MSFQLSGNTGTVPLPVILQILQQAKVSGMLTVRRGDVEKCVHFKDGEIIFATSADVQDRLGEVLVKAGSLRRENLTKALSLYQSGGKLKKIGAILVENKFVSPKDLFTGLKMQVKEIIYSLFLWEDAAYRFEERIAPDVIELHLDLQELISEIIARITQEG
jgi:hypothetical protein